MNKTLLGIFSMGLLCLLCCGCSNQPDPTKDPNFNKKAVEDPGSVRLPDMPNMQQPGATN
jgi:hypothetical protein